MFGLPTAASLHDVLPDTESCKYGPRNVASAQDRTLYITID